jgi:hypothetical protein
MSTTISNFPITSVNPEDVQLAQNTITAGDKFVVQNGNVPKVLPLPEALKLFFAKVNSVPLSTIPTPTGNLTNRGEMVTAANGFSYYIDAYGKAILLGIISKGVFKSDQDAKDNGLDIGDVYELHAENDLGSIGGIFKKVLAAIALFFFLSVPLKAQIVQRGIAPNTIPIFNAAYVWHDTTAKIMYQFKRPKWFAYGTFSQSATPQSEITNGQITINYTEAQWNNTLNGLTYEWNGTTWVSGLIDISNVVFLTGNQTINGQKTFAEIAKFDTGIKSEGLIDSKGVKTAGSQNSPSIQLDGVILEKDTIVSTNFALNGNYGTIGFDCTNVFRDCILPLSATTKDWTFTIRKEDNSTNPLRIKDSTGAIIYTVLNKLTITFKNKNGTWKRVQ